MTIMPRRGRSPPLSILASFEALDKTMMNAENAHLLKNVV